MTLNHAFAKLIVSKKLLYLGHMYIEVRDCYENQTFSFLFRSFMYFESDPDLNYLFVCIFLKSVISM